MIVRRYLAWSQSAPPEARADATGALARAYLDSDMEPFERVEAEAALALALDDPSPLVRMALAEALGDSDQAPRYIVAALAADASCIASVVLARSPLFTDAELIEQAAAGDVVAQVAVASRAELSAPVAAALAEVGEEDAVAVLASNPGAHLPEFSLQRSIERFGASQRVRAAILTRHGLSVPLRHALLCAERRELLDQRDGLTPLRREQLLREEEDRVAVALAVSCSDEDVAVLVSHLRSTGRLTAGLLLRSLLSGDMRLAIEAVADLAAMPERRVAALMAEPRSGGWRAMYRKAGLPEPLMDAFASAIEACRIVLAQASGFETGAALARRIVGQAIQACERGAAAPSDKVMALLRRLEAEISREEARIAAAMLLDHVRVEEAVPLALPAPANMDTVADQGDVALHAGPPAAANDPVPGVIEALEEALCLRGSIVDETSGADLGEAVGLEASSPDESPVAEEAPPSCQPEHPSVEPAPFSAEALAMKRVEEMIKQAFGEAVRIRAA